MKWNRGAEGNSAYSNKHKYTKQSEFLKLESTNLLNVSSKFNKCLLSMRLTPREQEEKGKGCINQED